jgi:hypothetical protein
MTKRALPCFAGAPLPTSSVPPCPAATGVVPNIPRNIFQNPTYFHPVLSTLERLGRYGSHSSGTRLWFVSGLVPRITSR